MVANALRVSPSSRMSSCVPRCWSITEMVNILVSAKKMLRGEVAEIESRLINERRLNDLRIFLLDVSPLKDYDFNEFFFMSERESSPIIPGWETSSMASS